jgi:hypothetical protein
MVSQLGTLLIIFGFWKYGKEYCSIYYITKSLIGDFPIVHSEHDIIIFNFVSAFCTFVKYRNELFFFFFKVYLNMSRLSTVCVKRNPTGDTNRVC